MSDKLVVQFQEPDAFTKKRFKTQRQKKRKSLCKIFIFGFILCICVCLSFINPFNPKVNLMVFFAYFFFFYSIFSLALLNDYFSFIKKIEKPYNLTFYETKICIEGGVEESIIVDWKYIDSWFIEKQDRILFFSLNPFDIHIKSFSLRWNSVIYFAIPKSADILMIYNLLIEKRGEKRERIDLSSEYCKGTSSSN